MSLAVTLGASYLQNGQCRFRVWAPVAQQVEVHIVAPHQDWLLPMTRDKRGYHEALADGVEPGSLYYYRLDGGKERPDPASRYQPEGVHGPSQVAGTFFPWDDGCWAGIPLRDYIIYELHVGAFTPEGTFDAVIPHLDGLKDLGITAVELMPVAQFPGNRNWGYDAVYAFAVQESYGGPEGLKRLVSACHRMELAVILDVVFNHLGPEGNYLADFGPYFTHRYRTPWGPALNFDGPDSDEVRGFFIENALYWITEFHIDALRLDAVHAILDQSPRPFLDELGAAVRERAEGLKRQIYVVPESAANDARLVRSRDLGGYGLDAQWNDDFHHSLHVLLTGERTGYYEDFGSLQHLAKAFREGFVYAGEYSAYRRHRHGISSLDIPAHRLVVFAQNHDQAGNRMLGERLSQLVSLEALKLAAGLVLLSPYVPLLFMGEEYGETAPFQYFTSHSDPALVEGVARGRKEEFAAFKWNGEPPDPQDEATFLRAKIDHNLRHGGHHQALLQFYKEIIRLRKEVRPLAHLSKDNMDVRSYENAHLLLVRRWVDEEEAAAVFHFGRAPTSVTVTLPAGRWQKRLDSTDERWHGPGSTVPGVVTSNEEVSLALLPQSFFLFTRKEEP